MKAMILAAGLGTRLRPLTNTTPKPLLSVGGTPLIVWNLLLLRRHGLRDVLINLHYLGAQIEQALGDGSRYGMRIAYSHEPVILGTGGGLKQAESWFGGESVVVVNGDTLVEIDLGEVCARHRERRATVTMVLREDPEAVRWGLVEMDAQQRVHRINGKGSIGTAAPVQRMFAGLHVFEPRVLQRLPPAGTESSVIEAYTGALADGELIVGYDVRGYWSDVGTPERYAQAERDVAVGLIALSGRS
ncbi:MAG: nucleotidyltransferase family protein [Nitrospiraceae bacterium]